MPPNHKPSPATLACLGLHLCLSAEWRRRGSQAGRITTATAPRQPLYSQPDSFATADAAGGTASLPNSSPPFAGRPAGRPSVRPWPWRPPASAGQARRRLPLHPALQHISPALNHPDTPPPPPKEGARSEAR
ncbi:hypothetical protein ACQJBY_000502 [Aegilops geniculata]